VVTLHTVKLNTKNSMFSPHSVFKCFVWIYTVLTDWLSQPRWSVFTVWYKQNI